MSSFSYSLVSKLLISWKSCTTETCDFIGIVSLHIYKENNTVCRHSARSSGCISQNFTICNIQCYFRCSPHFRGYRNCLFSHFECTTCIVSSDFQCSIQQITFLQPHFGRNISGSIIGVQFHRTAQYIFPFSLSIFLLPCYIPCSCHLFYGSTARFCFIITCSKCK